jgi:molybdopterin/thiamine biosynthesis adenylyltransferase
MEDAYLEQFSRHILLDEIGVEGQAVFRRSHVVVVGVGGLGCPAALYLTAAGVGRLTLVDGDTVDLSNLQRQILHTLGSVGLPKVVSAAATLKTISSATNIYPIQASLDEVAAEGLFAQADLVIDCSDNFPTRYMINRVCQKLRVSLVSGSAVRFTGQLAVFDFTKSNSPCYHCLFPEGEEVSEDRCAVTGIFAPVTGVVGTLLAGEALKMIIRKSGWQSIPLKDFQPFLLRYNGLAATFARSHIFCDPSCLVCGV